MQKLGFKCDAYLDGYKTIDALERASDNGRPFHLILMDVQMPNCDGYKGERLALWRSMHMLTQREATQLIRKHTNPDIRNILIIAMTASAIEGDKEKCIASGMNNYLAKPVRAQTLKGLLESYLNKTGEGKDIPNLQAEAQNLVKQALNEAGSGPGAKENQNHGVKKPLDALVDEETGKTKMRSRPSSVRSVTQRWLGPNAKDGTSPS